ncbi:hypothetical protein C8F04DRAFT_1240554 [Mycena alexandri]|uniref:Uncharacterized protein n=1 Tax=Mycena alexandri TaxID=1745969 RepID=A0AAD6WRZ2_9AGAR|nr:hypothetical protein C8F04DRAFT_1240554 [Mycena alexandri]
MGAGTVPGMFAETRQISLTWVTRVKDPLHSSAEPSSVELNVSDSDSAPKRITFGQSVGKRRGGINRGLNKRQACIRASSTQMDGNFDIAVVETYRRAVIRGALSRGPGKSRGVPCRGVPAVAVLACPGLRLTQSRH